MSRRPAGALAGIAIVFLFAAPGGAAAGRPGSADALEVPRPAAPMRDVVWGAPGAAAARISATASSQRYAIGDGTRSDDRGRRHRRLRGDLHRRRPAADRRLHRHADPRPRGQPGHGPARHALPARLRLRLRRRGLLLHRREQDRPQRQRGNRRGRRRPRLRPRPRVRAPRRPAPRPAGARSRARSTGGPSAGPASRASATGRRHGKLFPGDEGDHYFEDPGEAFAEAFAHNRFPEASVRWRWLRELAPTADSFRAIQEDTLSPWQGRTSFVLSGRVPARGEGAAVESLPTPLDGTVTLRPVGLHRRGYELALRSRAGRLLRSSRPHARRQLDFTVCGQSRLRLEIRSRSTRPTPYRLQIQRP